MIRITVGLSFLVTYLLLVAVVLEDHHRTALFNDRHPHLQREVPTATAILECTLVVAFPGLLLVYSGMRARKRTATQQAGLKTISEPAILRTPSGSSQSSKTSPVAHSGKICLELFVLGGGFEPGPESSAFAEKFMNSNSSEIDFRKAEIHTGSVLRWTQSSKVGSHIWSPHLFMWYATQGREFNAKAILFNDYYDDRSGKGYIVAANVYCP